ncbi:MAG: ABC transporter substrate-binding protein [Vicinamibacterales bacterium]
MAAPSPHLIVFATVGLLLGGLAASPGPSVLATQTAEGVRPRRVVSFVPAVTEMLFAMGAGDRVVGVSSFDRFPAEVERLPKVGGLLDPQVERVLSLRADLAVIYRSQHELREQLNRAGIAQFEYVHRDLADVTRTIREVGRTIGASAGAERLAARIDRDLQVVRERAVGRTRPRTLLVFGRESGTLNRILASGGYGFLHDLLELAGANNVLSDVKRESVELGVEAILARSPEVIIEVTYGRALTEAAQERAKRDWDQIPAVPAVRLRRIHLLQGDQFVIPGPRLVDAARRIQAALIARQSQN